MQGYEPDYGPGRDPEDWDDLSDLPDPWNGDHNIEYWVWNGARLIPATPEQRAHIQEDERTWAARRRLAKLQERERREARSMARRLSTAKAWWSAQVSVATQRLRRGWHWGQAPRMEGVRAERPSTKR